jgi:hypothetical protein
MLRGSRVACGLTFLVALVTIAWADERLQGIACRSVHLRYRAPEGVAFYSELTVDQSADGPGPTS